MIELRGVTKQYGETVILNGADYTFPQRGLVCLMGPSGAGKTTLLNLLAGFDTDYSGGIAVGGALLRELDENGLCRYRRDNIGFVFQNYHLLAGYTALENVCLARSPSIDPANTEKQAASLLERLKAIFRSPSLQMVSYTITEKGYALTTIKGEFFPFVQADFENGPGRCSHAMSVTAALLLERFNAGGAPIAVVSMDNCSHNGEKLRTSVMTVVEQWLKRDLVSPEFAVWVANESMVSFPWSMIDKITPRPAKVVEDALTAAGVEDMAPIVTGKNTFIAPFVNAERPQYLVVEDRFPNGRPPLEKAGVYMTDRDTVNNTEKMKVTTCLNPLHTALAVYGCLLGYKSIAAEMKDPQLKALVEKIGYDEGIPVVVDPKILSPMDFIHEVIDQRLPNPFIPDMPQRIATDTSQKVPIRFGETIKSYIARPDLDVTSLTYIPLAIAGWLRYLLAVDDEGKPMECSADPMLETLQKQLAAVKLGGPASASDEVLAPILSNPALFAIDLCEIGLAGKISGMLREMLTGPGAVRNTLEKYLPC